MNIHYCVFHNYKGLIFKRHISNSHLLFIPTIDQFLYLILFGTNDHNIIYGALLLKDYSFKMNVIINAQQKEFGKSFHDVESLFSICEQVGSEEYNIKLPNPGKYIKSDIHIKYYENNKVHLSGKDYYIYALDFVFDPLSPMDSIDSSNSIDLKMFEMRKLSR